MATRRDNELALVFRGLLISYFLVRYAAFQSNSYLTMQQEPFPDKPVLKLWMCRDQTRDLLAISQTR